MKDRFFVLRFFFFTGFAALFLTGCGLKYTPPETLENLEEARRDAIQNNYTESFKTRNKSYSPLSYGQLVVVKPDSYQKLDSLFERKYALQQLRSDVKPIDEQIEIQKAVVLNDTNPVLYVETHWFELKQDSVHEFIVDRISLDKSNRIRRVEQLDYFVGPPTLLVFARKYMLEAPFSGYGTETSDQEIEFYTTYKEHAAALKGSQKQAFVEHTLKVMQLASKNSTLSVETLLTRMVQQTLTKKDPSVGLSTLKITVDRVMEEKSGNDTFLYYKVTASVPGSDNTQEFYYDYFLQQL